MDDLPELPFEKVLSYLSLEERLKSKAVSRRWYHKISSFQVKSLCFSELPSDFILGKSRWLSGAYGKNFIGSKRFASFFDSYGQSMLSKLKHLRSCDLDLSETAARALVSTINSFDRLEELSIIRFTCWSNLIDRLFEFELHLPMLNAIHLEALQGIDRVALDAPRLKKIELWACSFLRLVIVHRDSVERVLTEKLDHIELQRLTNLKYLYCQRARGIDRTFLANLEQLKEIHMAGRHALTELFVQKQRYRRTVLQIYRFGLRLSGPDDPILARSGFQRSNKELFVHLATHHSRLADEIPHRNYLNYTTVEGVAPELAAPVLTRLRGVKKVCVGQSVQDIQLFLDLLNNLQHVEELRFLRGQPQELFDRLSEHRALQKLEIRRAPSDFAFLFTLRNLVHLDLHRLTIEMELVRKLFEELHFLSSIQFQYANRDVRIQTEDPSRLFFWVRIGKGDHLHCDAHVHLDAAIDFVIDTIDTMLSKKQKAAVMQ